MPPYLEDGQRRRKISNIEASFANESTKSKLLRELEAW
jgi:hypothetical protein